MNRKEQSVIDNYDNSMKKFEKNLSELSDAKTSIDSVKTLAEEKNFNTQIIDSAKKEFESQISEIKENIEKMRKAKEYVDSHSEDAVHDGKQGTKGKVAKYNENVNNVLKCHRAISNLIANLNTTYENCKKDSYFASLFEEVNAKKIEENKGVSDNNVGEQAVVESEERASIEQQSQEQNSTEEARATVSSQRNGESNQDIDSQIRSSSERLQTLTRERNETENPDLRFSLEQQIAQERSYRQSLLNQKVDNEARDNAEQSQEQNSTEEARTTASTQRNNGESNQDIDNQIRSSSERLRILTRERNETENPDLLFSIDQQIAQERSYRQSLLNQKVNNEARDNAEQSQEQNSTEETKKKDDGSVQNQDNALSEKDARRLELLKGSYGLNEKSTVTETLRKAKENRNSLKKQLNEKKKIPGASRSIIEQLTARIRQYDDDIEFLEGLDQDIDTNKDSQNNDNIDINNDNRDDKNANDSNNGKNNDGSKDDIGDDGSKDDKDDNGNNENPSKLDRNPDGSLKYPPAPIDDKKYELAIKDNEKHPPALVDDNKTKSEDEKLPTVDKTALYIFNEQYQKMPEMKARHSLSENPLIKLPFGLVPAAVTALPFIGVGLTAPISLAIIGAGVAGGFVAKPILKKITGQSSLEKKLQAQFENMDPDEFKKMTDYFSKEENMIAIKPHCAIINAMNKASKNIYKEERSNLVQMRADCDRRFKELQDKEKLTEDERDEFISLDKQIKGLDKDIDDMNVKIKGLKRGAKLKSADYKGNFSGSKLLNIFHRRNSTTKEYKEPLNELANADQAKHESEIFEKYYDEKGDKKMGKVHAVNAAEMRAECEKIFGKNTKISSILKLSKGAFNAGENNTTVRVTSDQKDNTVKNVCMLATITASFARIVHNINSLYNAQEHNADEATKAVDTHNKSVDEKQSQIDDLKNTVKLSNEQRVTAVKGEAGTEAAIKESVAVDDNGNVRYDNVDYVKADTDLNQEAAQNLSDIKSHQNDNMSIPDRINDIADHMTKYRGTAMGDKANSIAGMETPKSGVDHSAQEELAQYGEEGTKVEANLLNQCADLLRKINSMSPGSKIAANLQHVAKDVIVPLVVAALPTAGTIAKNTKDNIQEQKENDKYKGR